MIDIQQCPICNGTNFSPFLTCTDHAVSHETFHLKRCDSCSHLITSARPANDQLEKYYLSDTYTSHIKRGKTLIDTVYLLARRFTLKWKMSLVARYTSLSDKTLLDFGCGVGEFLKTASQKGWAITGVEPSEVARKNSDSTVSPHILPSLTELTRKHQKFDAITAWHVLEHVPDLHGNISILKKLLNPHGTMFIAVPNHNSWDAKHYANHWAGYDVPRHLWHFNIDSMTRLLRAHSLTVVEIIPMRLDAYYVSLLSEQYLGRTTLARLINATVNGLRSNYNARNNNQYSSLIYIVKQ